MFTLKSAQEFCKSRDRYFNTEKNNNFCQCKTNKFDENNVCVKKCTWEFYDEEKIWIIKCNEYKLKVQFNSWLFKHPTFSVIFSILKAKQLPFGI